MIVGIAVEVTVCSMEASTITSISAAVTKRRSRTRVEEETSGEATDKVSLLMASLSQERRRGTLTGKATPACCKKHRKDRRARLGDERSKSHRRRRQHKPEVGGKQREVQRAGRAVEVE